MLAGYWLDETDGTDGLYGTLVGRGCDRPTLAGSGTGVSPLAPERERHHGLSRSGGLWEVVTDPNCVGASWARSICVRAAK